jgi:2-haloacid dehalogenase
MRTGFGARILGIHRLISGTDRKDAALPRTYMFDAYGTLFDVHSAVLRAGGALGDKAPAFSALWRAKQLEYTWTISLMGRAGETANDFWALTGRALDFSLAEFQAEDALLREALLDAYRRLDAFPDVAPSLAGLKADGHRTAIFTNGTTIMINAAIAAAGLVGLIDSIITVEGTGFYKPRPEVYRHALQQSGESDPAALVFVSSNRWDVAGAASFGFTPIWVNRSRRPDEYVDLAPIATLPDLTGLGGV